jgi:hypothetical protein
MSDSPAPVVPIRLGLAARYGDTQAMNDVCALLTGPAGLIADEVAASVAQIVARTGLSAGVGNGLLAALGDAGAGVGAGAGDQHPVFDECAECPAAGQGGKQRRPPSNALRTPDAQGTAGARLVTT